MIPVRPELERLPSPRGSATLVWRFTDPVLLASTGPLGGGIGLRPWIVNAQVRPGYGRLDPDEHLVEIASALGLTGAGAGFLTAADVDRACSATDEGVTVEVTVGLDDPSWAAADDEDAPLVGTINTVVQVPARLSDAALVNAVATVTEAKVQALLDAGVRGTGTATDAVGVACPTRGEPEPFGGPRSTWGARLARATYRAVRAGAPQLR